MQKSRQWARLSLLAALSVCPSTGSLLGQETVGLDETRLSEVEDLSESLANALLELSVAVRRGDLKTISTFLGDEVVYGSVD